MHDLILWLATKLAETPKTVEQLNQAYIAIERKDKFGCMYALTSLVDELEAQGTQLPQKYLGTIDQVCQEATELVEKSLQGKQVGGDPLALGLGIGGGALVLIILMIWGYRKWRRRAGATLERPTMSEPSFESTLPDISSMPRDPKAFRWRASSNTLRNPDQVYPPDTDLLKNPSLIKPAEEALYQILWKMGVGAQTAPPEIVHRFFNEGTKDPMVRAWIQDQIDAVS